MAEMKMPRFMISATGSGCGKTTITCGILKALMNRGLKVAAFKSGPDYIDPMFHSKVIGAKSRNLDVFMLGKETVKYLATKNACDVDVSVFEGAMGFYDGMGKTAEASAYDLAHTCDVPVILIVNGKGAALSVAAQITCLCVVDLTESVVLRHFADDVTVSAEAAHKADHQELAVALCSLHHFLCLSYIYKAS